jgi:acetyltransferase
MSIRNLEFAFRARSIAVIGGSESEGSVGRTVMLNVRNAGFAGAIYPVNPKHQEVFGLPCYAKVADLPAAPDLAVLMTPPQTVPGLIADLGRRGTRAAVVLTAGISDANGLRPAMLDAAQPHTLRIIGPNCLGIFVPEIGLNASFAHLSPQKGNLAFLSQSGALASAVLDWTADRHIGFSTVVSMGDMADVDVADMLDMLAGDASSRAVLMYLETVTHARKFMSAARAVSRVKPVIVIKSGRHAEAAKAAATHTGALAGADGAVEAAFRRAGLLRVPDLEDLFDAAETLARFRPIARGRLGIVTNGGGAGVLAVDCLADFGGELATLAPTTLAALDAVLPDTWSHANPVDIIGDAGPERYRAAVEAVFADPGADALLVMACPTALASAKDSAAAVADTVRAIETRGGEWHKPVLTSWLGDHDAEPARNILRAAGIATYDTPADAVRSLGYLTGYSAAQRALLRIPSSAPEAPCDAPAARSVLRKAAEKHRTTLSEPEAKQVLAAFGVPVVETMVARSPAEIEGFATELLKRNDSVAVKLVSRAVTHKSDVGGVVLNLRTAKAAEQAAREIAENVARRAPKAPIDGFTVQAMVERPGAHELIIGVSEDPLFGPIILFGAGGTSVEVVADTAIALPPLDTSLAKDLISRTRISRLLAGYRDRPAADVDAIARALVAISQMIVDCPEVASLDINPLLADANGVIALDARVVVDPKRIGEAAPNRRLAIRPYPAAWEKQVTTNGGFAISLRPIRPEDAALYPRFVAGLTERDLRLRLLAPRKHFPDDFLARLTQIDYAREMAFVALDAEGALLGVGRLTANSDYTRADFAVIVRSDIHGHGVGWALMQQLIAYARSEGLAELDGVVHAENTEMLRMARELGFTVGPEEGEPQLFRVRMMLRG